MSEAPESAAPAATEAPPQADAPPAASVADVLFPKEVSSPSPEHSGGSVEGADSSAAPSTEAAASEPEPKAGEPAEDAVEYEFTTPEGFEFDDELSASAKEALRAAGVPKDKAQALVDVYTAAMTKAQAKAQAAFDEQQAAWLSEIEAIPDFQGPTKEKSLQTIGRLFDNYGTPEVKEALNMYSIGNNPALAKFLLSVAKALDEGEPSRPGGVAPNGKDGKSLAGRSLGQILFPESPT